jgi:TPR repeat protein
VNHAGEHLALLHLDGQGTPIDAVRGREILERGCAANVMFTRHVLGVRLRDGKGLPVNPAAALAAFENGCTLGWARSCLAASDQLTAPTSGLTQDPKRAAELRTRGCTLEPNICK